MGATAGNDSHVEFVPIHAMFDIVSGETSRSRETVLGAIHRRTGEHVGIRRPALEFSTGLEALRRTIALDHQNVLRVKTVLRDKEGVYFVTEWAEGGSLARRLGDAPLEGEQLAPALLHVARGLDYLHRAGAAPVDLGLDQILEDANGVFKLGGFGLHEQNEEASGEETSVPGGGGTGAFARRVREDLRSFGRTMLRLAGGAEGLPAPLKPIADRCLAEDQEQAFPDAARLVAALEKVTSGGSTSGASSRSGGERSRGVGQGVFPWLRTTDLYLEQGEAMRGGMGSVRMAIERATGRRVAIKRLLPDASRDAEGLQRFLREASSIANLDHPHILKLLQPGRDEHGDYLVLEWAAGGSLREKLERDGPLPVDEVVEVARKIGRALAFAHSKGVIHRDVKPHNILLTETGEPKLADFGLARAVGDHTLSSSHAGGGSPLYMPPEQHDRSRQADERSDLYSLGKTLYHLVTGLSPSSPQAKNLPPRLRRAVMRCLEEDPAKRPASAQAFLKELEPTPSSLRLAVPLALVFLVAAALAWRARETDETAPSVEPRVSKPTVSTPLPAVVLAGFFGADDEPLAGGAETSSEVVEVRLDLRNVSPEERERLKVEVLRGGEALDEGAFTSTWEDESRLVLSVPIEGRTNRLQVKVPDFGFASEVLELTRAEPLPTVVAVRDAERQAGESARYLTGRREVGVTVEVARAGGIDRLWIGRGSERQEVPLAGTGAERAIDPDVRLEEGENAFRWYWPTPEEPLGTGAFAIVGDFTPPVVSLREPRSGALTNRDALAIRGRVEDAHVGEEVVWRLSRDGEELASGRPHAESNGAFEDELSLVEAGEGTFVLDVVAHDRAGNASQPVGVSLTVDRTAPELVPGDGLSFRPVFDASLRLAAVDLEGHADEELSAAEVDGRPATLLPGGRFEAKGLPARDGPAAYRVSLVDRAGNVSRDFTAGHGIDVTSPTASLEFFERDGIAFLRVSPSEPLTSLSVGGRSTSASGSGPLEASTGRRLDELVTWKDAPGPTRSPVEVELVDAAGNRTAYAVVVCPSDRRSAVRCKMGAGGDVVGTERCAVCGGEYCPRTGDRGRKVREDGAVHGHPVVKDAATGAWVEVDHWMLDPQCRYCGFFRAP